MKKEDAQDARVRIDGFSVPDAWRHRFGPGSAGRTRSSKPCGHYVPDEAPQGSASPLSSHGTPGHSSPLVERPETAMAQRAWR